MNARLDDRLGFSAVTYVLFGVKVGPGLALTLVLVFAIWIGWRWLCAEMKPLIVLMIVIPAATARDRKPETCDSYTAMTGTTTTECRIPGHKPTTCGEPHGSRGRRRAVCRSGRKGFASVSPITLRALAIILAASPPQPARARSAIAFVLTEELK